MRTKLVLTLLICFIAIGGCEKPVEWQGREVGGIFPDLAFTLTGSDHSPRSASDYHGKVTLLFFGFTNCPGICPATLGHLSVALDALGEDRSKVQVLLVSVDPERDTPEAMKEYTARFGPWLHGLTGSEADLRALNNAYKVDFSALPADESGNYDVMHSARVFAFDPQGQCRVMLPEASDTDAVVSDLRKLLAEAGMI